MHFHGQQGPGCLNVGYDSSKESFTVLLPSFTIAFIFNLRKVIFVDDLNKASSIYRIFDASLIGNFFDDPPIF